MKNLPQVFSYADKEIRVIIQDNELWWVAKDICEILEVKNSRDALLRLDEDEKMTLQGKESLVGLTDDPNVTQLTLINEPGLYVLILGSRKKEAKLFKRWITHEVIPSVRKHGAYMTTEVMERTLSDPDFIIGIVTALKEEQQKRMKAEKKLEQDEPYSKFAKSIANSSDCISVGEFAKIYGNKKGAKIGRNRFFVWLREKGYLISHGKSRNIPKQQYIDQGLFQVKETLLNPNNIDIIRITTLITGKGQLYFTDKLNNEFSSLSA